MKSLCTCRQVVKLAEGTATFYQDDEMEITKQMKEAGFQEKIPYLPSKFRVLFYLPL